MMIEGSENETPENNGNKLSEQRWPRCVVASGGYVL